MKSISAWIFGRLSEPSTLAGIAAVITVSNQAIQTQDWQSIAAAVFGLGAMLFRERGAQA